MNITPNLHLPYISPNQAQKHITHNDAVRALDAITQISVLTQVYGAPPENPIEGDRYIVATASTGSWATYDHKIAAWQDGAWAFYSPQSGWICWDISQDTFFVWSGTNWIKAFNEGTSTNPTPFVGVNATASTTNRLSIASPASLFNHEGNDHQLKINKNASTDTASFIFQQNFTGHAEVGLTGNNNFHFKVSSDGSSWNDAMMIDRNTGNIGINTTAPATKLHIAQSADYSGIIITGYDTESSDHLSLDVGGVVGRISTNKPNLYFSVGGTTPLRISSNTITVLGSLTLSESLVIDTDNFLRLGTSWNYRFGYSGVNDRLELTDSINNVFLYVDDNGGTADFNFNNGDVFIKNNGQVGIATTTPSTTLDVNGPIKFGAYTVANVPNAASTGAGATIFVTNESGGNNLAFSDGTNWRRVSDRAIIS